MTWATVTTRRHKVVQQRDTIVQTTAPKRKQNHANTRAHQKTSSQRKKEKTFVCVSQHINTAENLAQQWIPVVLHSVATRIDKDHQRQHVMGTAQDADKEACVRGRKELRQNTRRTNASEHQLSASSPMRKNNNKSFFVQRCANTTQDPQGT